MKELLKNLDCMEVVISGFVQTVHFNDLKGVLKVSGDVCYITYPHDTTTPMFMFMIDQIEIVDIGNPHRIRLKTK